MEQKKRGKIRFDWIGTLALLIAINVVASFLHYRVDLTEEKRYSLTSATKNLVKSLEEPLSINVFLKGDFPSEFRKLSNATSEFLSVMKDASPSKIQYRFIDPADPVSEGRSWGDSLQSLGISPINISVQVKSGEEKKNAYPFALLIYKGDTSLVNLFENSKKSISASELNNAEAMMEYQFTKSINGLVQPEKILVAYATGNGEPVDASTYGLQQTIAANYSLGMFDLKVQPAIPTTIKTLMIVKPTIPFSEGEKLKIDQYIMRGGKVIWFIDNLHAEQDSLSFKSQLIAYERNLGLEDQLFRYGVRINPDLVMDLQCDFLPFAVGGSASEPQYEFLHWNYYPIFESKENHPINKSMGLVTGRFVNSIDTVGSPGIKKTFLLQSSSNSRIISTPALISPNENRNAPQDELFKQHNIPVAVLLEGRFTSFYKNRISRAQADSLSTTGGFMEQNREDNKMILVADGDIILNDV
ncbi:MAG TPA: gliding motility-associated ABC transporter substrate-binding protein GldG, partial [Chitinophagaceae bacterium]|nr:gliding motility-associated ABC transporter substrate-binding protein GldG [Chitinophagaceae bacterium]